MNLRTSATPQYGIILEDFTAESQFEMDVKGGELIQIISQTNSHWTYISRLTDSRHGYIPTLYYIRLETKLLIKHLINHIKLTKKHNLSISSSSSASTDIYSSSSSSSSFSSSSTSSSSSSSSFLSSMSTVSSFSSSSSSFGSLFNERIDDSLSQVSSLENRDLTNLINDRLQIKINSNHYSDRSDPDGISLSDFSGLKINPSPVNNSLQSKKIYENLEPRDYEIRIFHNCDPSSLNDTLSTPCTKIVSSRYEINFPECALEIPRRLFIDVGRKYSLLPQELLDSFNKLTLV